MRPIAFAAALLFCFCSISCGDAAQADEVIYVDEADGQKILNSAIKAQFWPLMRHFETQQIPTYCAIASSAMVLNALLDSRKIAAPHTTRIYPCQEFNQDNLFSQSVQEAMWKYKATFTRQQIMGSGTTLEQLEVILGAVPAKVEVHYADSVPLKKFREMAIRALAENEQYIIVNFARTALEQDGNGHMSPLAAYDSKTDRFLILDVSRYKYPATWATAKQLWTAMNTDDPTSKKKRGFILVSAPKERLQIEVHRPSDCPPPQSAKAAFFGK